MLQSSSPRRRNTPPLITRNPTQAQVDAVCSARLGDCQQPFAAILDNRARNLASLKTRGVDVVLDYFVDSARGKVTFSLNGTYTINQKQQITSTAARAGSPVRNSISGSTTLSTSALPSSTNSALTLALSVTTRPMPV
jgi:hypothetical protein